MLKTLKTLIKIQLAEKRILKKIKGKGKIAVFFLLRILAVLAITAVSAGVFFIIKNIIQVKIDKELLLFIIGVTQIISIIANIELFKNALYLSRDNEILFSFPARHGEIFISRLTVFYINEFIKNLYFILPIILGYGLYAGIGVNFLFNLLLAVAILPLFPVLIGALLSLPAMYIKKLLNAFPVINAVLSLGIISGIFVLIIRLLHRLPVPLRILALYNSFINGLQGFLQDFNRYLVVYKNISNFLFESRAASDYLIVFAVIGALVLFVYLLAMPLYFSIVSHFKDVSIVKTHSGKNKERNSYFAFLQKEFKVLYRTSGKLFSYLSFVVAFPFLIYIINYIFSAINTNELGDILVLVFNLMIGLVLLTANNTISAVSLSSEGLEFASLKATPCKIYNIAFAKITINIVFSMLAIISGFTVLFFITKISNVNLILLFAVFILINTGHIFWSFQFDIINPKFAELGL